jgi:very-short-patch-repair endonuclease
MFDSLKLHQNASAEIFYKASMLRKNMTETENKLWQLIRNKQLGVKFRRQHPLGPYVVDFYSHEIRLIIEVDGKYHFTEPQKEMDKSRDEKIIASGCRILRFTDDQIDFNLNDVIIEIKHEIDSIKLNAPVK